MRTGALSGRMTVHAALDRLLAGTGYRAVRGAGGGYRVVRAVAPPKPRPAPAPPAAAPAADVVVTGSKQRIALLRNPGTVTRLTGTPTLPGGTVAAPSDLTRILPVMQSTQLGPGRNKVFVRGIADSSFNGTTLSTSASIWTMCRSARPGPTPACACTTCRAWR